jgi:F-type H+-transporting ATPase subunit b
MQFNWSTFLFQIVNFLILVFILYKVLYKPITNIIKKRREAIAEKFAQARSEQEDAEKIKKEYNAKLVGINREQNKILTQARQEAEAERSHLIAEARKTADGERNKAMQSLDQDIEKHLDDLQAHIVASITHLAKHLLQQVVGKDLDEYLGKHMVDKIRDLHKGDLHLPMNKTVDAALFAAQDPGRHVVEQFRTALHEVFGLDVDVTVHTESSMAAGFRLEIGELVLDAGIDRQLEEWTENLKKSLRRHA